MKEWKTANGPKMNAAVGFRPFAILSSSILSSSIHFPSNPLRL
jgi:hypothetical protein